VNPGRELDAVIAEKVMRLDMEYFMTIPKKPTGAYAVSRTPLVIADIPHYSTDIAAAWAVAEKMNERQTYTGYRFAILFDGDAWCVGFDHPDLKGGTWLEKLGYSSVSAAHAICLAGLQEIGSS
jgi:hypothetical protein